MIDIYTLSNGEQIIGEKVRTLREGADTIQNPFYIVETQDEFGNNGMKLINVCTFSTEQYIVVDNMHIIYKMPANEAMTRYYNKLVEASKKADTYKMIEDSIKDMEDMEETLRETISKRLVGKSTIN
jgi:GTP1/Obg family GTP-binding protein